MLDKIDSFRGKEIVYFGEDGRVSFSDGKELYLVPGEDRTIEICSQDGHNVLIHGVKEFNQHFSLERYNLQMIPQRSPSGKVTRIILTLREKDRKYPVLKLGLDSVETDGYYLQISSPKSVTGQSLY